MSRRRGGGPAPAMQAVVKASSIQIEASQAFESDDYARTFNDLGALAYPGAIDPRDLNALVADSSSLRVNIEALEANVESFGHRAEPRLKFDAPDLRERVADALMQKAHAQGDDDPAEPTEAEVDAEIARLKRRARIELGVFNSFFKSVSYDGSFTELRRRTRRDMETTGNAYWEVLRDKRGRVSRFRLIPSYMVRLLPLDCEWVEVPEWQPLNDVEQEQVTVPRRLRRYVQIEDTTGRSVYMRDYRETRTLSSRSGKFYADNAALALSEPGVPPANEIIHFKIWWPESAYGMPRWLGALFEVKSDRAAAETNHSMLNDSGIPPLVVMVSGGSLASGVPDAMREHFGKDGKGPKRRGKVLIIEAESDGKTGTAPRVEIQPLSQEIKDDGLYLKFSAGNKRVIGAQFRLPPIVRGDTDDFNRATAEAALQMSEEQVFGPLREALDNWINTVLLPDLGVFFWTFRSQGPVVINPDRLAQITKAFAEIGAITPAEAREIAAEVFHKPLNPIPYPWQRMPVGFTLASAQTGNPIPGTEASEGQPAQPDAAAAAAKVVEDLLGMAAQVEAAKQAQAERRAAAARAALNAQVAGMADVVGQIGQWAQGSDADLTLGV